MDHALQPERDDASKKLADQSYWGDTGIWVHRAVVQMEAVFHHLPHSHTAPLRDWLNTVIEAIEVAHENYRDDEDDPDGYGSATFHQVLNRLRGLYEKTPEGS